MLRLGFITNPQREDLVAAVRTALCKARACGIACAVEDSLLDKLDADSFAATRPDVLLPFGGDGTILRAVPRAVELDVPICGVNLGRVGFLSEIAATDIDAALWDLGEGRYTVEAHMMLQCSVAGNTYNCINDVLIYKSSFSGVVGVRVSVDGVDAGMVRGDGLVVSTPTGATGYSISAGGPVIAPGADVAVITPVCPHALAFRPIIAGADARIALGTDRPAHLAVDGSPVSDINESDVICISRAAERVKFVRFGKRNLYVLIHDKLS